MVGDQLTSSCLVPDQNSVRVCKGEGWPRDPGGKRQRGWTGERERQGRRQTSGQAREGPAGPGRAALWSGRVGEAGITTLILNELRIGLQRIQRPAGDRRPGLWLRKRGNRACWELWERANSSWARLRGKGALGGPRATDAGIPVEGSWRRRHSSGEECFTVGDVI